MDRLQKTALIVAAVVTLTLVSAFVILSVVLVRLHSAAERAGNEAATIQNVKTICAVETQYFSNNRTFATLDQLVKEQSLSSKFAAHPLVVDGYALKLVIKSNPTSSVSSFSLTADPLSDSTGTTHYYLESTCGDIHVNRAAPAGPNDALLDHAEF